MKVPKTIGAFAFKCFSKTLLKRSLCVCISSLKGEHAFTATHLQRARPISRVPDAFGVGAVGFSSLWARNAFGQHRSKNVVAWQGTASSREWKVGTATLFVEIKLDACSSYFAVVRVHSQLSSNEWSVAPNDPVEFVPLENIKSMTHFNSSGKVFVHLPKF